MIILNRYDTHFGHICSYVCWIWWKWNTNKVNLNTLTSHSLFPAWANNPNADFSRIDKSVVRRFTKESYTTNFPGHLSIFLLQISKVNQQVYITNHLTSEFSIWVLKNFWQENSEVLWANFEICSPNFKPSGNKYATSVSQLEVVVLGPRKRPKELSIFICWAKLSSNFSSGAWLAPFEKS